MDDKTKKIILLGTAMVGMGVFTFFTLFPPHKKDHDHTGFTNPTTIDEGYSRQSINDEKRKRERQFSYDRKVYSIDDFLKDEVEKEPWSGGLKAEGGELGAEGGQRAESHSYAEATEGEAIRAEGEGFRAESREQREGGQGLREEVPSYAKATEADRKRRTGFASGGMDVTENKMSGTGMVNAMAVVQESRRLRSGMAVKLRIIEPFMAGERKIPANTFVSGNVRISRDRIFIEVTHIPAEGSLVPVKLKAYDMSGNEGLILEGGLDKDIRGDALEEAVNEIQKNVQVPILRSLPFTSARKKISEPEVPVEAGLKVWLRGW